MIQLEIRDRAVEVYRQTNADRAEQEREQAFRKEAALRDQLRDLMRTRLALDVPPVAFQAGPKTTIDGLTFTTVERGLSDYARASLYLERPCAKCGDACTVEVRSLYDLGGILSDPENRYSHDWDCVGYKQEQAAEEVGALGIEKSRDLAMLSIADRLQSIVKEIVEDVLASRGEV
jgi:hypothetical protein